MKMYTIQLATNGSIPFPCILHLHVLCSAFRPAFHQMKFSSCRDGVDSCFGRCDVLVSSKASAGQDLLHESGSKRSGLLHRSRHRLG